MSASLQNYWRRSLAFSCNYVRLACFLIILSAFLTPDFVIAQQASFQNPSVSDAQYDAKKLQMIVGQSTPVDGAPATRPITQVVRPSCFEPYDTTAAGGWTQVPRNDDGFVGPVNLGWDFSLFGTVYNKVYINNNGNITFNAGLSAFTPGGFPIATPMVAAFWADVDTRNTASGSAWYKLYPDRLVVTWSYVGYYNQQADKKNTFQMVIKANTAPSFTGNDVLFSYDDMQWTTGSASGGVGGFGGAAATVGVNRGNNVDYIQTGRFNINSNQPPNVPSVGSPGGVSWLDGQCIGYQVRGSSGNVPPSVAGLPDNNTITLNQGESRTVSLQFSGPETNQNVNVTSNLNGLCNASITTTNNDTPNPNTTFQVTGGICNGGTRDVTFTALDNGTPAASQTFTIRVIVLAPPVVDHLIPDQITTIGQNFSFAIPGNTFSDPNGDPLTLSVSGLPTGLNFANGVISGIPQSLGTSTVTVTATDPGGLFVRTTFTITVVAQVVPLSLTFTAMPSTIQTGSTTTLLASVSGGASPYSYVFSGPGTITPSGNMATVSGLSVGVQTFTVVVHDATTPTSQSITGTTSVTVVVPTPGNTPPTVANPIGPQSATVGIGYSLSLSNVFTDAETPNQLTLSVSGLPAGLNFTAPATISGIPSVSGISTITLTATDPGSLSATTSFILTVYPAGSIPPPSGNFSITGVSGVSCQTLSVGKRQLTFTPQYTGLNGNPVSFSVVNEMLATTNAGPYNLNLYTDNPVITLSALQSGVSSNFVYNWLAVCDGMTPPSPPVAFRITGVSGVSCQTLSVGKRQLTFTPQYTGLNGNPVSFSVVNEMLATTNAGPYNLNLYTDNPVITLSALQSGVSSNFVYNWLAACSGNARLGNLAESNLSVRILGNPIQQDQVRVEVRGASGQPLSIILSDIKGHILGSHQVEQAGLEENHTFEVSRVAQGVLLLRASTPTQSQTVKLLKNE